MNEDLQDSIDLIIISGWTYANGYISAWLLPFELDIIRTAAAFGMMGTCLAIIGAIRKRITGRYPPLISLMVFGLPFSCSFISVGIFLLDWVGLY